MPPLAATFPVHDWQFWVATVIALGALILVLRTLLPARLLPRPLRRKSRGTRAPLTISARRDGPAPRGS